MPQDILDCTEKTPNYPPRIDLLALPKDSKKVAFIKWAIYIIAALGLIIFLVVDAPNNKKVNTLLGMGIALGIAFPLLAVFFLNFLLNGVIWLIHRLIIAQVRDTRVHNIYSKIYFTTPVTLLLLLYLILFIVLT